MNDPTFSPPPPLRFGPLQDPRFFGLEAGPADGPLVIMLHGFPDLSWGWRHQVAALAAEGYHVVAPDQRGYGCSFRPKQMAEYRLARLVEDVLDLADAYAATRFRLVGHDWGGNIAWWTAARHPNRVAQAAVVNAPHPDAWLEVLRTDPRQLLRSWYVLFFQIPLLPEFLLSRRRCALLRAAQRGSARPGAFPADDDALYSSGFGGMHQVRAMLNYYRALRFKESPAPRVTVPMLLLWGDRDRFLTLRIPEQSLTHCTNARLIHFPAASHWLPIEEPARVSAELLAFFAPPMALTRAGLVFNPTRTNVA